MHIQVTCPFKNDQRILNLFTSSMVDAVGDRVIYTGESPDGEVTIASIINGNSNTARVTLYKFFSSLEKYLKRATDSFVHPDYYKAFDINNSPVSMMKGTSTVTRTRVQYCGTSKWVYSSFVIDEDENPSKNREDYKHFRFTIDMDIVGKPENNIHYFKDVYISTIFIPNCLIRIKEESHDLSNDNGSDRLEVTLVGDVSYDKNVCINDLIVAVCSSVIRYNAIGNTATAKIINCLFNELRKEHVKTYLRNNFIEFYKGRYSGEFFNNNLYLECGEGCEHLIESLLFSIERDERSEMGLIKTINVVEAELVNDLNMLIKNAVDHGGDSGGVYCTNANDLMDSVNRILVALQLDEDYKVVWNEGTHDGYGDNESIPVIKPKN